MIRPSEKSAKFASLAVLLLTLTGCSLSVPNAAAGPTAGPALRGSVHGGQQPITGATIQLYAAGASGYGIGASTLGPSTITDANGNFTLTGTYTCASSSSELYLIATGGNPGLPSGINSAIALTAALGPCNYAGTGGPTLNPSSYIVVNEATTVAAAYALAQFWQPNTFLVGTSATNSTGLANAFTTAQTLVDNSTGAAYATTPPLNSATVPQTKINTLANILAACVNTSGTDGTCASLFSYVAPQNSTAPTNTLSAALDIALSPATGVSSLYGMAGSTTPFQPALPAAPTDFSLAEVVQYPGIHEYDGVAIDSYGDAWTGGQELGSGSNPPTGVLEVSPAGDPLSGPAPGYTDSHFTAPDLLTIDSNNNVWAVDLFSRFNGIVEFANNGADLTPSGGILTPPIQGRNSPYTIIAIVASGSDIVLANGTTGASNPDAPDGGIIELNASGTIINSSNEFNPGSLIVGPLSIALDSANTIWVANPYISTTDTLYHFDFSGNSLPTNPATGGGLYNPRSMATDSNRNLWAANYYSTTGTGMVVGSVSEFNSSGSPLSPSTGYGDSSLYLPSCIAVDGNGFVWVANALTSIVELNPSGVVLSGASGFYDPSIYNPNGMAIDASGNIWISNHNTIPGTNGSLTKFIGIAAPVATPLGLNGSYGQRP